MTLNSSFRNKTPAKSFRKQFICKNTGNICANVKMLHLKVLCGREYYSTHYQCQPLILAQQQVQT